MQGVWDLGFYNPQTEFKIVNFPRNGLYFNNLIHILIN